MFETDDVQEYWYTLENILINAFDKLAPLVEYTDQLFDNHAPPDSIKKLINKRKRLLKKNKIINCPDTCSQIKVLNKDIKNYFFYEKIKLH